MKKYCLLTMILFVFLPAMLCPAEVVRTTEYERGADAEVGNDTQLGPGTNAGGAQRMRIRQHPARIKLAIVRFDIDGVVGDMSEAYLTFETIWQKGSNKQATVYGLIDESLDEWDEMSVTYNTAPGIVPASATPETVQLDMTKLVNLGTLTTPPVPDPEVYPVRFSSDPAQLDLTDFLASSTNGLVTFLILGADDETELATKEHPDYLAPTLTMPNAAEGGPANPGPEHGATVTDLYLPQLCWDNFAIDRANLWFGAGDANAVNYQDRLTFIATVDDIEDGQRICHPIPEAYHPLDVPATYTWVVEGYAYNPDEPQPTEPNTLLATSIFQFHTSAIPLVKVQPVDQYVFPNDTAVLTAEVESLSPLSDAIWYKEGQALDVADVIIEPLTAIRYQVTLTLSDVDASDQGGYYLIAQNAGGSSDATSTAWLAIKRKLAHWNFDGDVTDETGVYNGTLLYDPNGAPNWVTDEDRLALEFDGDYTHVELPEGFDNFRAGMTVSVWARPTAAGNWARFIDFGRFTEDDPPGQINNILFTRMGTGATLRFDSGNGAVDAAGAIALNEWQHFVATMTETGAVTIYKNGLPIQTGTVSRPDVVTRTHNYIGQSNWPDDLYEGLMDDLRVYNYAISADDVADQYSDAAGAFCRNRPELDWSGNCIVDISDFAIFASSWLECGLWPVSACVGF